jgi:hypothetical protein
MQKREEINTKMQIDRLGNRKSVIIGAFIHFIILFSLRSSITNVFSTQREALMTKVSQVNFLFLLLSLLSIGFALILGNVEACQPIPAKQMELIRERFRTATVLFPPPELRNLTDAQLQVLNKTIDQLIQLKSPTHTNSMSYDEIEQSFLSAMRENANQVSHG